MFTRWTNILGLIIFLIAIGSTEGSAQIKPPPTQESEHGWHIAPYGQLHVLVVFAEMKFDSGYQHLDPCKPKGEWKWKAGKLPEWKDELFSGRRTGKALMTRYFREASWGKFTVTGDYLDSMITVNISDVRNHRNKIVTHEPFGNNWYKKAVLSQVNAIEDPKFAFGSKVEDFDRWTFAGSGQPKTEESNGKIDLIMLIWRNIHVANLGDHAGFVSPGNFGTVMGQSTDMYSIFSTRNFLPAVICRHEFSHMLYGGNNFHTANGGVGSRMFIPTVGGYSNMSASDSYSRTWNGWDRERMNWKNPRNEYLLQAKCATTGEAFETDLEYGEPLCGDGTFILRDFIDHGDVVKIKLPHMPDGVRNQYLWLENHTLNPKNYDHPKRAAPGLYTYLQVGKDERVGNKVFGDNNNYLWPLAAEGNYDFILGGEKKQDLILQDQRANPFTGYNYLMRIVTDKDNDGLIRVTNDIRPKTEYTLPNKRIVNGREMPESYITYQTYPIFGTRGIPYRADSAWTKMGISYNPAAVPVYTHSGGRGAPGRDNRRIYLNGLSIEVLEQRRNGDMVIKIRWDDFDIVRPVRWCGNILSNEQVNVRSGNSISLDQGYTVQEVRAVQQFNGEQLFAKPTVLELAAGSELHLNSFSQLWVRKGSTLIIRKGAKVILEKNSAIEIQEGSFLYVEEGADIELKHRKAKINRWNGSELGINELLKDEFEDLGTMDDSWK